MTIAGFEHGQGPVKYKPSPSEETSVVDFALSTRIRNFADALREKAR